MGKAFRALITGFQSAGSSEEGSSGRRRYSALKAGQPSRAILLAVASIASTIAGAKSTFFASHSERMSRLSREIRSGSAYRKRAS
jgi:hypothetical protein